MTLAERLRAALDRSRDAAPALLTGDLSALELAGGAGPATRAAVLVAVTDRPRPGVILTQRTETLRNHAGQIAFPGGRIDPGDADAVAAALREAEEEIGLDPRDVAVIGVVDGYRTVTGYDVTPVLAVIAPDLPLVPAEAEVAAVFEVPMDFLFDPANQRQASEMWQGRMRHYYEIEWQGRRIWGATAAMIVNLSRRIGR